MYMNNNDSNELKRLKLKLKSLATQWLGVAVNCYYIPNAVSIRPCSFSDLSELSGPFLKYRI